MPQRLELIIEIDGKRQNLRDLEDIRRAVGRLGEDAEKSGDQLAGIGDGLGGLAFRFNNVLQAAQTFFSQLSRGYDLLIGQNERFNQGLLESASTLAANSDIVQGGELIVDPTEAILALQAPIEESIKRVEEATRSLVGVTEQETAAIFNTILSNSALLAEQSQEFPDAIRAAESLAPGLTAALGTLQVPLAQASQEIRALLQGDIDPNAALANALQISRQDIERARSAGELVDFLNSRFETFTAANALAAQSVAGITSNIQGLIEVASRAAGEPLYDTLVEQLSRLEQFLVANEPAIQAFGIALGEITANTIQPIGDALVDEVIPALFEFFEALSGSAGGLEELAEFAGEGTADLLGLLASVLKIGADNAELLSLAIKALVIQFAALKLSAAVTALQGLAAGFVATTTAATVASTTLGATNAGLLLLTTSSGAASAGLVTLAGSAAATTVALLPIVGAFAAIAAAINLVQLTNYTNELRRLNKEVEDLAIVNDAAQDAAIRSAQRTKAAIDTVNSAKAQGVVLNEEELQQYGRLADANDQRIEGLREELELLRQQRDEIPTNRGSEDDALRNALDARIASTEVSLGLLERQNEQLRESAELEASRSDDIEIGLRRLEDLGSVSEQVTQRLEQAFGRATAGEGAIQDATEAAKEAIDLTNQALEQGIIDPAEAIANLRRLADEDTLNSDQRIAAAQALTQVQERENNRRLQDNRTQQQEVQRLVAQGELRDIEGQRQLTVLRAQELDQRLSDVQNFLEQERQAGRGDGARAQELIQQEQELQTQLIEARVEAERIARQQVQEELERQVQEANDLITEAEQSRLLATQELLNDGVISQREADEQRVDSTRRRIIGELAIERQRVEALQALPTPNDPEEREALDRQIRAGLQRTSQLQLSLLETERQQQEQLADRIRQNLEDQITLIQRKAAATQRAYDAETSALQRQNQLLSAQQSLTSARASLIETEGQIRIDQLNEAQQLQQQLNTTEDRGVRNLIRGRLRQLGIRGDEEDIARAIANQEIELAQQQLEQFDRQAEARRQQLEIDLQLEQAAQRRLEIETRLALAQAQNQLAQAEAIVDPEARERAVTAANDAVVAAQGAVGEAAQQEQLQAQIATLSRETLAIELEREQAQIRATAQSEIFAANLRKAQISAEGIEGALGNASAGGVQAFKDGGVPNRGLALVGEAGPELVRFGSTARVFSNPETQKIAQRALSTTGLSPGIVGRAAGPSSLGDAKVLKSLGRIEKALSSMPNGVTINGLNMPQSFKLPNDQKLAAKEAARVMRNWEKDLLRRGER